MIKFQNQHRIKLIDRRLLLGVSMLSLACAGLPSSAGAKDGAETTIEAAKTRQFFGEDTHQIRFRADTLVVEPVLNIALAGAVRSAVAGEQAEFQTYNNYPSLIERGEVRIIRAGDTADAEPLAVLPVHAEGHAAWPVPNDAPDALAYVYRVYSKDGKFDETRAHELTIVSRPLADHMTHSSQIGDRVAGGADETARRAITISGLMATVTGQVASGDDVRVNGQPAVIDRNGRFVSQQILARKDGGMIVSVMRDGREIKRAEQDFAAPKEDWFVVGQGEVTLGKSYGSGPAKQVSGDPLSDGSYAMGRGAFYAKGVVGDDVRVTAALDTGETLLKDLFSNLDRKDPSQLLRRLNREQFYPTYGDSSTLVEDAPTQGRFYLRVAKDQSQMVIGNFVTQVNGAELAQLDRGLFGALADIKSNGVTSFGERRVQITGFASDPGTVPGREEFRGTGGSLYFLKRQDVSVGSERVRIEVRDVNTGMVLESRDLNAQQDYDFDPFQGRITLLRPLSSTAANGAVVREGASSGNVPVLVVRYEYTPPVGALDGYTLGGRASAWVHDALKLGITAQRDTVEEAAQTLLGADATLRLTAGTYLKGELAQTDGPSFGQSNSVDGGLSFTDIALPSAGRKAQAWRTELAVNIAEIAKRTGDLGTASAFYEDYDAGFAPAGRLSPSATKRWGGAVRLPLGTTGSVTAKYDELQSASAGANKTGTLDLANSFAMGRGKLTASAGMRYESRTPGLLYNSVQDGERTDAALALEYAPSRNIALHSFGQATLNKDAGRFRNNRAGGGINAQLTQRLSMESEVSGGDGGLGADIRFNHRLGEGAESYVGYSLFADTTETGLDSQNIFTRSNSGTLVVGSRRRFTDSLSIHGENRVGMGGTAPSLSRSFGLRFDPTERLSFTGSFENGRIDDATTGLIRRTAGSIGVGYVSEGVRIGSSIELRDEKGAGRDQTVWLLRNDASLSVNPDWTLLGRINMAQADNNSASVRAAEFTEAMGGFAYRPVHNDRLNLLARLTYFEDMGPVGQITGSGQLESPKQVSTVASLDFTYDLSKRVTLGGKYGYRLGKVSLGRDSNSFVSSDAHLFVLRADYHVNKKWDVMLEGRGLWVTLADDKRFGALGAVYRYLGNNVKLGVGYSLSDFSDNLTDQSYSSHGPFLNILGKF